MEQSVGCCIICYDTTQISSILSWCNAKTWRCESQPLNLELGSRLTRRQYGERAFRAYVDQYGRSSGRKDLLTKILSVKRETEAAQLTDRETSFEVGNLIFAGTGTVASGSFFDQPW